MQIDPYARAAPLYDRIFEPFLSPVRDKTADLLSRRWGSAPSGPVLEVACGTGSQAFRIARKWSRVVALDRSPAMLARLVRKSRAGARMPVAAVCGDGAVLPFSDGLFSAVIVQLGLHEMSGPMRAGTVKEIRRVLKIGGDLVALDFIPSTGLTPASLALSVVEFLAGWEHFRNGRSFLREGGLIALLSEYGLEVEDTWTYFGKTLCLAVARKR